MTTSRYRRPIHDAIAVHALKIGRVMPDRPRQHDALSHVAPDDPDTLAAPEVDYDLPTQLARLAAAIDTLPERHRAVIEARLDGLSFAEAGARIGRSGQRAAQIEREVVCRLREARFGLCRWFDGEWVDSRGRAWPCRRWEAA
ncbi:MAG TPA: sigma factor-like helix-turn-helix DNA-binding protein [Gemmatimonadaceae bacterium]|nr:sigma factor-like helix-turn-helix DNA-binding protein [Gemmatimonadaceae bacterium]